jgi:hypothetical protein
MNDLRQQPRPRQDVIGALREAATRDTSVRELVHIIHSRLGYREDALIPALWYLTAAFGLTLREALPIREWIGSPYDREIDALILPAIARNREKWADPDLTLNSESTSAGLELKLKGLHRGADKRDAF